jgi:hypothetical protein
MSLFRLFSSAPRPIGVVITDKGKTRIELWGPNEWRVYRYGKPDEEFARDIAGVYSDRLVHRGPSDGHYGPAVLRDVAERFGGTFTVRKLGPLPARVTS